MGLSPSPVVSSFPLVREAPYDQLTHLTAVYARRLATGNRHRVGVRTPSRREFEELTQQYAIGCGDLWAARVHNWTRARRLNDEHVDR